MTKDLQLGLKLCMFSNSLIIFSNSTGRYSIALDIIEGRIRHRWETVGTWKWRISVLDGTLYVLGFLAHMVRFTEHVHVPGTRTQDPLRSDTKEMTRRFRHEYWVLNRAEVFWYFYDVYEFQLCEREGSISTPYLFFPWISVLFALILEGMENLL